MLRARAAPSCPALSTARLALLFLFACNHRPGLGEHCAATADCASQLTCGQRDATATVGTKHEDAIALPGLDHACTARCDHTVDCVDLGAHAYCAGANVCLRGCAQDADCPAMTYCYDHAYSRPNGSDVAAKKNDHCESRIGVWRRLILWTSCYGCRSGNALDLRASSSAALMMLRTAMPTSYGTRRSNDAQLRCAPAPPIHVRRRREQRTSR